MIRERLREGLGGVISRAKTSTLPAAQRSIKVRSGSRKGPTATSGGAARVLRSGATRRLEVRHFLSYVVEKLTGSKPMFDGCLDYQRFDKYK